MKKLLSLFAFLAFAAPALATPMASAVMETGDPTGFLRCSVVLVPFVTDTVTVELMTANGSVLAQNTCVVSAGNRECVVYAFTVSPAFCTANVTVGSKGDFRGALNVESCEGSYCYVTASTPVQ